MPDEKARNTSSFNHAPILTDEVMKSINNLPPKMLDGGLMVDATLGGGGHCASILKAHPNLRVIGLDQDPSARQAAAQALAIFGSRIKILETNFADFKPPEKAIFVLADLGVSSPQLDIGARGFSFRLDGPLDMRMNPSTKLTAKKIIESYEENDLADLIYNYGEEKRSRRIARRIKRDLCLHGPYSGTTALAYAIAGCYPPKMRKSRIHPATRTFQALRIAVNNELEALESFLAKSPDWLVDDGLLNVISFHSLEDRRVKTAFLNDPRLERISRKPLSASGNEISANPRSRSAKYRIARKKSLSTSK